MLACVLSQEVMRMGGGFMGAELLAYTEDAATLLKAQHIVQATLAALSLNLRLLHKHCLGLARLDLSQSHVILSLRDFADLVVCKKGLLLGQAVMQQQSLPIAADGLVDLLWPTNTAALMPSLTELSLTLGKVT